VQELRDLKVPDTVRVSSNGLALVTSLEDATAILGAVRRGRQQASLAQKAPPPRPQPHRRPGKSSSSERGFDVSAYVSMEQPAIAEFSAEASDSSPPESGQATVLRDDGAGATPFSAEGGVTRDWKGDVVAVNPDDKLPFRFL